MRPSQSLVLALCGCALAVVVSCNGRIGRETCGGGVTDSNVSGFCDSDGGGYDPGVPSGPFPGPGFDASTCPGQSVLTYHPGPHCPPDDFGGAAPGQSCTAAEDCASVCCVADDRGVFAPDREEADASADAGADADADASADADADADAGEDGGTRFDSRRVSSCLCGRCASAEERCAALNKPMGLGGP